MCGCATEEAAAGATQGGLRLRASMVKGVSQAERGKEGWVASVGDGPERYRKRGGGGGAGPPRRGGGQHHCRGLPGLPLLALRHVLENLLPMKLPAHP